MTRTIIFNDAREMTDYLVKEVNKENWPKKIRRFFDMKECQETRELIMAGKKDFQSKLAYMGASLRLKVEVEKACFDFPYSCSVEVMATSKELWRIKQELLAKANVYVNEMDEKRNTAPALEGLYLVSNIVFNPITDEKLHLVKIGYSTNLASRMNNYRTQNPMLYHIDYYLDKKVSETEFHIEMLLSDKFQKLDNAQEWFITDEKTYFEICEGGFQYFIDRM